MREKRSKMMSKSLYLALDCADQRHERGLDGLGLGAGQLHPEQEVGLQSRMSGSA